MTDALQAEIWRRFNEALRETSRTVDAMLDRQAIDRALAGIREAVEELRRVNKR